MKSTEKYLSFGAGTAGTCGVLELGFLSFFSFLASSFLSFDLMIWLGYVLIMFLGLNWLKSDDLGSKGRNLGSKQSGKGQKDPWESCCRNKRWPGLTVHRLTEAPSWGPSIGPVRQAFTKIDIIFYSKVWFYHGRWLWKDNSIIDLWVGHGTPNSFCVKI